MSIFDNIFEDFERRLDEIFGDGNAHSSRRQSFNSKEDFENYVRNFFLHLTVAQRHTLTITTTEGQLNLTITMECELSEKEKLHFFEFFLSSNSPDAFVHEVERVFPKSSGTASTYRAGPKINVTIRRADDSLFPTYEKDRNDADRAGESIAVVGGAFAAFGAMFKVVSWLLPEKKEA